MFLIGKKLKQVTKACLYGHYRDGNDCKGKNISNYLIK